MLRRIARPMLASYFLVDGVNTARNAAEHAADTEAMLERVRKVVPAAYAQYVPQDPELVTQVLGGTRSVSSSLLALGKAPRVNAALLAGTMLPNLLGRDAFWDATTPAEKEARRNGFVTSTALLGALMIVAQDTEGKPSLRWRTTKAAQRTADKVSAALPTKSEQEKLQDKLSDQATKIGAQAQTLVSDAAVKAQEASAKAQAYVEDNRGDWEETGRALLAAGRELATEARDAALVKAEVARERAHDRAQAVDLSSFEKAAFLTKKDLSKRASQQLNRADKRLAKALKQVEKRLG